MRHVPTHCRERRLRRIAVAVVVGLLLCIAPASATTLPAGFGELHVVSGGANLNAPTAVAYAPDGRTFIAEKAGRVKVVNPGASTASVLLDIRNNVNHFSDRGLLGIEVDTDFAQNGFLYLLYVAELNQQTRDTDQPTVSRLTRVTVRPDNTLVLPTGSTNPETVILGKDSTPCPTPDNTRDCITADFYWHNIGTVRSDPSDGTLWLGTGDSHPGSPVNANTWRPYDENTFAGKIIHIDRNGRGLPGHPFCPGDNNLDHVCTKIYAKGFRNPFRFQVRPGKGPVVGDVGAGAKEEVDFIRPGGNYGWPCYEGTHKPPSRSSQPVCQQLYAKEGTTDAAIPPDWEYDHAGGASITLGPIYDGSTYPAHFRGDLFVGDYVKGWIKRLEIDANDNVTTVHDWATNWSGGVDLEMHPSGDLSDVDIGFGAEPPAVTRYTFTGSTNSPPTVVATATPTSGPPPLAVQFTGSGSSDPDGDALTFDWDFGDGTAHASVANPSHDYTTQGDYTARLTVTDSQGNSSSKEVPISVTPNQAPSVAITAPADESRYRNGSAVTLHGSGSDPEDGALSGVSLSWRILLIHGTHTHGFTELSGAETSFTPLVDHDSDSYYEIRLTATDSGGRSSSQTIELRPQTSNLELASSPAGAPLAYGDEQHAAPFSRQPAVGYRAQLTAP
jgi:glucose/arabinose dehydrogenase/PKD repeat protein